MVFFSPSKSNEEGCAALALTMAAILHPRTAGNEQISFLTFFFQIDNLYLVMLLARHGVASHATNLSVLFIA